MRNVALFYNSGNKEACDRAIGFLRRFEDMISIFADALTFSDYEKLKNIQIVITFGGDGFILRTANMIAAQALDIPMIRVNFGRVGFLANVKKSYLDERFKQFLDGKYIINKRNRLMVYFNGRKLTALNDVVIERNTPKIADYLLVIGEEMVDIRGDGAIIATRTGSTAYNRSAGGPILIDENKFVATKICPVNLESIPYYEVSIDTVIRISRIKKGNLRLVADGQESIVLEPDDFVEIKKCFYSTLFVEFGD